MYLFCFKLRQIGPPGLGNTCVKYTGNLHEMLEGMDECGTLELLVYDPVPGVNNRIQRPGWSFPGFQPT